MPTVTTLAEARSIVERAYGVSTADHGAEDARDFRVFFDPENPRGAATLVSKRTGKVREEAVYLNFTKLEAMRQLGPWPSAPSRP